MSSEKVMDLVRDAFYEGRELGPWPRLLTEDDKFSAWMGSEARRQAASDEYVARIEKERAELIQMLREADRRIIWEEHGLGRGFQDRVEAFTLPLSPLALDGDGK